MKQKKLVRVQYQLDNDRLLVGFYVVGVLLHRYRVSISFPDPNLQNEALSGWTRKLAVYFFDLRSPHLHHWSAANTSTRRTHRNDQNLFIN